MRLINPSTITCGMRTDMTRLLPDGVDFHANLLISARCLFRQNRRMGRMRRCTASQIIKACQVYNSLNGKL
jgi:hypothetical protein